MTSDIAAATGGTLHGPDVAITSATQDSRLVEPGALFIPLVAERDGHDFIPSAIDLGANAYLSHRPPLGEGTAIVVGDTMTALSTLGRAARDRLDGPVIGITGSVGKTSTKDLAAAVFAQARNTHASERSFNNEIGVPLTLINAPDDTEVALVEMGARGIGHIETLCAVGAPTVGVVTTVAGAHTGEFGSIENIAIAKGELIEALPPTGLAVLNADVPLAAGMASRSAAPVLTFGRNPSADVRVSSATLDDELRLHVRLDTPWGSLEASPATRGIQMATNTAAAVGVALHHGISQEHVVAGLSAAVVSPWRMDVRVAQSGALIINDAYNANPTSMRGALDSLSAVSRPRRIAIVGYMAELGDDERIQHEAIALAADDLGIELIAVGTDLYGVEPVDDVFKALSSLGPDLAIVVKASRSAALENLATALLDAPAG